MKTNKDNLRDLIRPHADFWDCYSDSPTEYDHTGKLVKICSEFSVSFSVFCAENYTLEFWDAGKKWFCRKSGKERTTEEILKMYLKQKV
jgi:hypothetical protein